MRVIDSRKLTEGKLVYDTRINVLYNEKSKVWEVLSGISRVVKCGPKVQNGNSILTNVSSGAEIAPLIIGHTKKGKSLEGMSFGPLLTAMRAKKTEVDVSSIK
jgi:acyl-CoA reductase-like NAD-dependent aldehyde dehydrogenase